MKDLRKNQKTLSTLCRLGACAGLATGGAWLIVFVATQRWPMAIMLLLLWLATLPCWLIARRGRFSLGLMTAQIACITFTLAFSLAFDIPSEAAPRTTHLFLLVIALIGYANFQREHARMQLVLIAAALLTFVVLSCTPLALAITPPPSDAFHAARAWINATLATLMLSAGIGAMHVDFINTIRNAVALRVALEHRQLELFYQPQIDARGQLVGAEALLRWRHPKRGYVSPAEFIPLAESTGMMPSIGNWVIHEACATLARWQARPQTCALTLSINITAEQFALPGFVQQLLAATAQCGVAPALLKLELTESAFLTDINSVIAKMHALREAGFSISLDDFGTGYSSLSYLRQLPLTQLKIDRSFVQGVDDTPRAAAIVRNIVQMGHDLSLDVLAEGVETEAQLRVMQSYGCKAFQGYWFARPMPFDDFEHYVTAGLAKQGYGRV